MAHLVGENRIFIVASMLQAPPVNYSLFAYIPLMTQLDSKREEFCFNPTTKSLNVLRLFKTI